MATKNKTAKKTAKQAEPSTRGNVYVLTAEGKKHLADVSGQGAAIRDCLKATSKGYTAAQIVERVGKSLKAPQPAKTVAFYLCTWKADGFVKFAK